MHDLSRNGEPVDDEPEISCLPSEFPGRWANKAKLYRSEHELTLDFIRLGPQGKQGLVVSRISFSPLLLGELREMINDVAELEA